MKRRRKPIENNRNIYKLRRRVGAAKTKAMRQIEISFISYYFYFFQRFISVYILLCFSFYLHTKKNLYSIFQDLKNISIMIGEGCKYQDTYNNTCIRRMKAELFLYFNGSSKKAARKAPNTELCISNTNTRLKTGKLVPRRHTEEHAGIIP